MDKVIFDRSIFHRKMFDALMNSGLRRCIEENRLRIFFTPRFIEETLQHAANSETEFKDQWEFLLQLNSAKWFKEPDEIVAIELRSNTRSVEYFFRPANDINKLIEGCNHFLQGQYSDHEYEDTQREFQRNKIRRRQFGDIRKLWRTDGVSVGDNFDEYFEGEVEKYIQNDFMKKHSNSSEYLENWRINRHASEFTEAYIRSQLALVYLAKVQTNRQPKIDKNDGTDAEQLAYLTWSDTIVSDDAKFMRECFNLLYERQGKKFMTLSEFLTFLESRN